MNQLSEFERKVFDAVQLLLDKDENIELPMVSNTYRRYNVYFDFELPEGCKALNIAPGCIVEVKSNVASNTINRVMHNYANLASRFPNFNYVFIYGGQDLYDLKFPVLENLKFISFTEIQNVIKQNRNISLSKETEKESQENFLNKYSNQYSENEFLINELKNSLISDRCSLILGAGVSKSANVPAWEDLLISLLQKKLELTEDDAKSKFQKLLKQSGGSYLIATRDILHNVNKEDQFNWLHDIIYSSTKESDLIKVICKLVKSRNISNIITFNYDVLLEEHLRKDKQTPISIAQKDYVPIDSLPVYHVHGVIPRKTEQSINGIKDYTLPVLSEDQYHTLYGNSYNWSNIQTLNTLNHNTCILIGLSLNDPNLRRLLEISYKTNGAEKQHYVFMGIDQSENEDFNKAQSEIFLELGLRTIWYTIYNKDHSQLISKLRTLI